MLEKKWSWSGADNNKNFHPTYKFPSAISDLVNTELYQLYQTAMTKEERNTKSNNYYLYFFQPENLLRPANYLAPLFLKNINVYKIHWYCGLVYTCNTGLSAKTRVTQD